MADKTYLAVKLDPSLRDRLVALSKAMRRTPQGIIREAIREYLEWQDVAEREVALARERLERYDATGEYVDGREVVAWLRSVGTARPLRPPAVRVSSKPRRRRRRD